MISKIWHFFGRLAFWLTWPALFLYLHGSTRTRVLLVAYDEVLLLKGWLGDGRWSLPGGGLGRGEDPRLGAVREVAEETGLNLDAARLREIYRGSIKHDSGLKFHAVAFMYRLNSKPELRLQKREIIDGKWVKLGRIVDMSEVGREAKALAQALADRDDLVK